MATVVTGVVVSGLASTGSGSSSNVHVRLCSTAQNWKVCSHGGFRVKLSSCVLTKADVPSSCSVCFHRHPTMPSTDVFFTQQHGCHLNYYVFLFLVGS